MDYTEVEFDLLVYMSVKHGLSHQLKNTVSVFLYSEGEGDMVTETYKDSWRHNTKYIGV
jgi:hypothetical protein